MTYGWAILVVLAAIAALAYFGVLSPDRFLPQKCTISGGFSCTEYKVTAGVGGAGTVQINVQNNLGVDADYVNVTLVPSSSSGCTLAVTAGYNPAQTAVGTGILHQVPGNPALTNSQASGLIDFTCSGGLGSKFKGDLTVEYRRAGETVTHKSSGQLSGTAE